MNKKYRKLTDHTPKPLIRFGGIFMSYGETLSIGNKKPRYKLMYWGLLGIL